MKKEELIKSIKKIKIEKTKYINETFYWVSIARQCVIKEQGERQLVFLVPQANNSKKMRTVKRDNVEEVTNRIINQDIFFSAFTSLVASIEDFLNKVVRMILATDEERIKFVLSDTSMLKSISIIDFISKEREMLINELIDNKVNALFYASPQKQLDYYERGLGIRIDDASWESWVEIKARRDLIVHNNAIVNDIYLTKVPSSVMKQGDKITVDELYFQDTVRILKHIVGSLSAIIVKNYKE